MLPQLGSPRCGAPGAIDVWDTGNYYESSRLLLAEPWKTMAAQANGSLVVSVPKRDTLIVACAPDRATLARMAETTDRFFRAADGPISRALLEWTGEGWRELKP